MKTIEIIINASGQLTINAAGFTGADCEKATAFLEQALPVTGQIQKPRPSPYAPPEFLRPSEEPSLAYFVLPFVKRAPSSEALSQTPL